MSAARERTLLLLYGLLLLLLFLGLIKVFINGGRTFLLLELLGLLVLVLLALLAFIGGHSWGKRVFMVVFLLYLLNLILIWLVKGRLYIVLLLLAAIGFAVSAFWERRRVEWSSPAATEEKEELAGRVSTPAKKEPLTGPSPSLVPPAFIKTFSPGKFVASSQSNQFHAPACDWAKKIQKQRQVWFQSAAEAFEQGYRQHSCLKKSL